MKNNQLTFILVGVFFLTTLATAVLSYKFVSSLHRMQVLQVRMVYVNNTQNFLNQLLNEAAEYGKKNPDIMPLVQSVAAPSPNAAAALPSTMPAK
jgi:hypothetical protein